MSEDQNHSLAVIVALPAADDPIHGLVDEDAHVTLHFLGKAAAIDSDDVEQMKTDLALLAGSLYPFTADVSGQATLGADKAAVLLVESAPLSKIRDIIGATPVVNDISATVEQYPNWIPHLTLTYSDTPPDTSGTTEFSVGALALWVGEERTDFPLAKAAPTMGGEEPVTAAGLHKFDPTLHPRGADGRFIEKFGIVKYLLGGVWHYGQVEGINKDTTDSTKTDITVTPSDLSGTPMGESIVLNPGQIYAAPKKIAHLDISHPDAKKTGGQKGSNEGGFYKIPAPAAVPLAPTGDLTAKPTMDFYVKKAQTPAHGKNEALANDLYAAAGVPAPQVDYAPDGNIYSQIITGQHDMSARLNDPEWLDKVRKNFAVDAWLANWDVFGLTNDNILTDAAGTPWRIDNGGALLYRAMGGKKGDDFGDKVGELASMKTGKNSKVYGPEMSINQEIDGAERVVGISPQTIDDMVSDAGLPQSLADTLKARRLYIAAHYKINLPEAQAPAGAQANTSAPLVDAPDLATSGGMSREWSREIPLAQASFVLTVGDMIRLPNGTKTEFGINPDGMIQSAIEQQSMLLSLQNSLPLDAKIRIRKNLGIFNKPRPADGAFLSAQDLAAQNWQRGDTLKDADTGEWLIVSGANEVTGAMLVRGQNGPLLLDTLGKDKNRTFMVKRWDPPKPVEAPAPVMNPAVTTPAPPAPLAPVPLSTPPVKTGQAVSLEKQIKADLVEPLPGDSVPSVAPSNPTESSTPSTPVDTTVDSKEMLLGDTTIAKPGDEVVSTKDGKTYVYVKPKGPFAVVTDPSAVDPEQTLMKSANTLTQPGKEKAAVEVKAPTLATGEVPTLGMQAIAKDGHEGKITLISPDGKFVFITDSAGKRKKKSVGTVSLVGAVQSSQDTPKVATGPIKDYITNDLGPSDYSTSLSEYVGKKTDGALMVVASDMVGVQYADGTPGIEPYVGQPDFTLAKSKTGGTALFGSIWDYTGGINAGHFGLATLSDDNNKDYTVLVNGEMFSTNGTMTPNGYLLVHPYDSSTGVYTAEVSPAALINVIEMSNPDSTLPTNTVPPITEVLPKGITTPLVGDEAKTLNDWMKQVEFKPGDEISLDGKNWLTVNDQGSTSMSLSVADLNGEPLDLWTMDASTYVYKPSPVSPPVDTTVTDDVQSPLYGQAGYDPTKVTLDDLKGAGQEAIVPQIRHLLSPGVTIDQYQGSTNGYVVLSYPIDTPEGKMVVLGFQSMTGMPPKMFKIDGFSDMSPWHVTAPEKTEVPDPWALYQVTEAVNNYLNTAPPTIDHVENMAKQGLTSPGWYPIYHAPGPNTYFRNSPSGVQMWDESGLSWLTVGATSKYTPDTLGEPVWMGGEPSDLPDGGLKFPADAKPKYEDLYGGYIPDPGEVLTFAPYANAEDAGYGDVLSKVENADQPTILLSNGKHQVVDWSQVDMAADYLPQVTVWNPYEENNGKVTPAAAPESIDPGAPAPSTPAIPAGAIALDSSTGGYNDGAIFQPKAGDTVLKVQQKFGSLAYYVQAQPNGTWFKILPDGKVSLSLTKANSNVEPFLKDPSTVPDGASLEVVHSPAGSTPITPVQKPAPVDTAQVFNGYTADPTDNVVQFVYNTTGTIKTMVQPKGTGDYFPILDNGTLDTNPDNAYFPATVDWAKASDDFTVTDLQSSSTPTAATAPPVPEPASKYAGFAHAVTFTADNAQVAGSGLSEQNLAKVNGLSLDAGDGLYFLVFSQGSTTGVPMVRKSNGAWYQVMSAGSGQANAKIMPSYTASSDKMFEDNFLSSYMLMMATLKAPSAAPVNTQIDLGGFGGNFADLGMPDPTTAKVVTDFSNVGPGWVYYIKQHAVSGDKNVTGLHVTGGVGQTEVNYDQLTGTYGQVNHGFDTITKLSSPSKIDLSLIAADSTMFYAPDSAVPLPNTTGPATPSSVAPAGGSNAPVVAPVLSTPAYPGAALPTSDDITSWGGDLTKDGYIPTSGMYVSGKGPMSGVIVGVSKDKTKATVLTSEGVKTTRLISALKVDKSANYQKYAAPISNKPIAEGMPLAVDTPDEAFKNVLADGKPKAIVGASPQVLHGEMVMTAAVAPSGKKFTRTFFTLTKEQREAVKAMLAASSGPQPKGDWVVTSKPSGDVAIGDQIPMRQATQTFDADGKPVWKVDGDKSIPTHKVTGVTTGDNGTLLVTLEALSDGTVITSTFITGKTLPIRTWDPDKVKHIPAGAFALSPDAQAMGWSIVNDGSVSAAKPVANSMMPTLDIEPGQPVPKNSSMNGGEPLTTGTSLRYVGPDGTVIEITNVVNYDNTSNGGFTAISVPEGSSAEAVTGALSLLGIEYAPATQDSAKKHVRGLLKNLVSQDITGIGTDGGWSDDKIFQTAGAVMGIPDLGWQDVYVGVDESTGKVSYFWSDRARNALVNKAKHNLIFRGGNDGSAEAITSTIKFGSANAILKRAMGMVYAPSGKGLGASPGSDNSGGAGHGSFTSAVKTTHLPIGNAQASYAGDAIMVYHSVGNVLGRIMDYKVSHNDAFGKGNGTGSNNMENAANWDKVRDYFLGGGLPSEAISFVSVKNATERDKAIAELHAEKIFTINGRKVEDIILLHNDTKKMTVNDLVPFSLPSNARPLLDLPEFYTKAPGTAAPAAADNTAGAVA